MSIRAALEEAISNAENDALEVPADAAPIEAAPADDIAAEAAADRDESGRFKAKESNGYESPKQDIEAAMAKDSAAAAPAEPEAKVEEPEEDYTPRPSTWKKEYLPLWDKARKGEPMSADEGRKLTDYLNQREQEYKKGVSTYKQEAERARQLEDAINPFVPELQAQGISPAAWINNLGRAHMVLTKAPYEERVQMFHRLAGEYGIQFNQMGQPQQPDPYAQQLMAQLQQNQNEVQMIKSRFQQEEDARLQSEIGQFSSDAAKYPHFEVLREDMAQLLELGKAQDIPTAYRLAVR